MENKNIPAEMMAREHEVDVDAIVETTIGDAEPLQETEAEAVHKAREHDVVDALITAADSDIGIEDVQKGIETAVVDTYKTIEEGVVGAYRKVEDAVVGAYRKVEDTFVEAFLAKDGETPEEAKARIKGEE